jgi:tetratricopeptide (TPR) repeat protein
LARARDREGRHRTLRTTIDWSYDLLVPEEQALLARLSVFAGGWTLESAEAVAQGSAPGTRHSLDRLADRSLVRVGEGPSATRYSMLETIREYASEKLRESGDEAAARARHAAWFLAFVRQAEWEPAQSGESVRDARLEAEHDNFRAALRWAIDEGHDRETGLRFCVALNRFWVMHGYIAEGRAWTESAVAAARRPPPALRVSSVFALCVLAEAQGDLERARTVLETALAESDEIEPTRLLRVRWRLGTVLERMGDYDAAESHLEEGLALAERHEGPPAVAALLNTLGIIAMDRHDFELARARWQRCLDIYRELDDPPNTAVALCNLGELSTYEESLGELGRARSCYAESLAIAREGGDREQVAYTLDGFARLAAAGGDAPRALRLAGAAARVGREIGLRPHPPQQTAFERALEPARLALAADEAAGALASGAEMGLDTAVAYALGGENT